MDITFKVAFYSSSDFVDYLLAFLKPSSLEVISSEIRIRGATLMSIEELESNIRAWADKHRPGAYVEFKIFSISLSPEEKEEIDKAVVFQNVLH